MISNNPVDDMLDSSNCEKSGFIENHFWFVDGVWINFQDFIDHQIVNSFLGFKARSDRKNTGARKFQGSKSKS